MSDRRRLHGTSGHYDVKIEAEYGINSLLQLGNRGTVMMAVTTSASTPILMTFLTMAHIGSF